MKNLDRFAELLDIKKEKYLIHNGIIWKIYKKMIQPLGPANYDCSITCKEARNISTKLGGILIRWTNGFIEDKSTEWYSVICDKFIPLEKLIAYSQNYIYAPTEANYSTIKFHPDFLKLYPSYALIYKMNEFYLKNKRFGYVNDGWRSIFHQSNMQSFLEKKFSFKKAYSNLHIIYKPSLHIFISNTYCFRNMLAIINPRLKALYFMEEARRKK